jgi:hypothetical protein
MPDRLLPRRALGDLDNGEVHFSVSFAVLGDHITLFIAPFKGITPFPPGGIGTATETPDTARLLKSAKHLPDHILVTPGQAWGVLVSEPKGFAVSARLFLISVAEDRLAKNNRTHA